MAKHHPCEKGITDKCIKEYPEWARKAIAYKLIYFFLPKELSRNLPFPLNRPLIGEGAVVPAGVDIPAGYVIPPEFDASGISGLSDLPASFSPEGASGVVCPPDTGASPPENFSILASTPSSQSVPNKGTLSVSTTPSGATVSIDAVEKGVSPLSLDLSPGDYALVLSLSGYKNHSETVSIVKGQTTTVTVILIPVDTPFDKEQQITLNIDENRNQLIFVDRELQKIYLVTDNPKNRVVEYDCSSLTKTARAELLTSYVSTCGVYDSINRLLFIGYYFDPGIIQKVDLSTMTLISHITLEAGESNLRGCANVVHNNYAYFLCFTAPGKIVKINTQTFIKEAVLTLDTGLNYPWDAVIDTANNMMYVICNDTPRKLVKINLETFSAVTTFECSAYTVKPKGICINVSKGYIVVFGDTLNAGAEKIRLSTLTRISEIDYSEGSSYIHGIVFLEDSEYAFVVGVGASGKVLKINTATLALEAVLNLSGVNDNFTGIEYNLYKNKLYITQDDSPVVFIVCGTGDT